ncbi:SDR family NAD(P)-dependent oxidoreductase [Gracilimonas sediminicola]|uniref:SDR family NAD(P)-dependent oxidoreductase n=1 Tax=Gracilimonas sediminicola TaxID=2952158 RepID=A0A9X2RGT1_9BACT|nr:SDR family NAD(P)-dependent oxidoreductase [Gracilimonas sediminicola]MCP9292572.1 SDR family NAD(P)-dependent oxidoreductase [Gracilimonas sediminicola]
MNRLKGKTAIVTGATAGIGYKTTELLAEQGVHLVVTGRREERLEEIKEKLESEYEVKVQTAAFDIRDADACRSFVESLTANIDLLVNNAGLAKGTDPVYDAEFDDWNTMIDTNVKGLLYLSRLIIPQMKERNTGHIINVGSTAGHESYAGGVVYTATKHAVKAITESTKKDLHGTEVRVSMVSPGLVETEFSEVRFKGDKEKAAEVYKGMKPLVAQDIAEIIVFVANRPAHVNIMDTIIYPTAQSSATMVHRDV